MKLTNYLWGIYAVIATIVLLSGVVLVQVFVAPSLKDKQLIFSFLGIIVILIIVVTIAFFLFHRIFYKRLWNYLSITLAKLEDFDVDEPSEVTFKPSKIEELNALNNNLNNLIERIRLDYHANKQFTQNASHELQTPLSVIKTNAELLIQAIHLNQYQAEALGNILSATNRLSKLNSALILLSKIERGRYVDEETQDVGVVTNEILRYFKDIIQLQALTVETDFQATPLLVNMSETLLEILITNLIQNAVRYNVKNGWIGIKITPTKFEISNTGEALTIPVADVFKRFKRSAHTEESLGLGLSIVKRICDYYEFEVGYSNEATTHKVTVAFH